jgi:hypothetical protein
MKGLADSLRDLGEPVAARTLVLNLLRGLSPRYGHLKALIKRTVPFPTFHVVRNELLLEGLTMTIEAPTPALALYSATPGVPFPIFHVVRNELLEELTMTIEAPILPQHSTAPPLVHRRLPGDKPPALRRPGPPLGPLPRHLRPLVRLPPSTEVVATARADVGAAAPTVEVPPAGMAARVGRRFTTPGPAPSPCGVRPPMHRVLRRGAGSPNGTTLRPASAPAYGDPHHDTLVPVRWRLGPSFSCRRLQHYGVGSTTL